MFIYLRSLRATLLQRTFHICSKHLIVLTKNQSWMRVSTILKEYLCSLIIAIRRHVFKFRQCCLHKLSSFPFNRVD